MVDSKRVYIGAVVEIPVDGVSQQYVINRITPQKGRLQIDCIEVDEARRRVRDLKALLDKAGLKEESS